MARVVKPGAPEIYNAAQRWRDECLDGDGSLFTPGANVWTQPNLADALDRVWVHGDATPGADYLDKLRRQLDGARPAVVQLVAELNAVHFLAVAPEATGAARKREIVDTILSWM